MTSAEFRKNVGEDLQTFAGDPYGFVRYAFMWGDGELVDCKIEDWQKDTLEAIGNGLLTVDEAIQIAIASGHGIGKSALVAWIILWAISTKENTRGIVTANTATQLTTKTWPELARWHRLFIGRDFFTLTATAIYSSNAKYERTWRFDAIPWSKTNSEAFAGLHGRGNRLVMIFDEASAISDVIWEVAEGALTDKNTEIIWLACGNPTRNSGKFFDAFHKLKHRWIHRQIDARKVGITNKIKIAKWVEDYGEDSDFVRIRARGVFPRYGDRQFISPDLVEEARIRGLSVHPESQNAFAKILTLDSAWTGVDEIVCGCRHGNNFKILWVQAKNDDDVALARRLAQTEDQENADAVFLDFAYGTGVYSVGKHMNRKWQLIAFGGEPMDKAKYMNKRAEMYGLGKIWLKNGGSLQDDPKLCEEIAVAEEIFREDSKVQLEGKEDIKDRVGYSPGRADAWALSFALPVRKKDPENQMRFGTHKPEFARPANYDPYQDMA